MNPPLIIPPGESRSAGSLKIFDDRILIKLSGRDTHGKYALMETISEPQCGPPLHRHLREDESFYILEGDFEFEVDGDRFRAGPGACVHTPRGTAHSFRNIGEKTGRMLVIAQPAGLDEMFEELAERTVTDAELTMSVAIPVFRKYGLELLGPPLADLT